MADVGRERAQLLVVSAIGLAVLLTALALTLNTAAYAGVHASQADDGPRESREALEYQESVHRAVAGMLANESTTQSSLRSDLETWDELTTPTYARDGVATAVSLESATAVNRIVQNETKTFEDQSDASNWTVAGNVTDAEAYVMEVESSQLATRDHCNSTGDCFTVTVEDADGGAWRLFAYSASGGDAIAMTVETADGDAYNCSAATPSATINVTGGVFANETGHTCSFEPFTDDAGLGSEYTVRYDRAHNVTGTYHLTVTGNVVDGTVEDDDRYGTTGSPRIHTEVVDATVSVRYRSPTVTYQTQIRVEAGEGDG